MAGEMRFGQQIEPGDASGVRELMPLAFADGVQIELMQQPFAKFLQCSPVAKAFRLAIQCLDDPLHAHERRSGAVRFR